MTTTETTQDRPALYVGTYAKYNNGSIKGAWLYLDDYKTPDDFLDACAKLHADETDPEYMYQDFEYLPVGVYSESMSFSELEEVYEWVNLDEDEREIVTEFMNAMGGNDLHYALEHAEDAYVTTITGSNNEVELAEYYIDVIGSLEIPEQLSPYFDYEKYGRDLMFDHSISENGFVFNSNY
jgi:antirestriction protein